MPTVRHRQVRRMLYRQAALLYILVTCSAGRCG